MQTRSIHPVTRLCAWLALLLAVQSLQGVWLAGACLVPLFSGRAVVGRGVRLVWRVRWFLLSIAVLFSWGVAGDPLWFGDAAPTKEGLFLACTHVGRLFLVLMAIAGFLESMTLSEMLAATHHLLGPIRRLGLNPDRGVIRLMLVLRYVESLPRPRDWKSLLEVPVSAIAEEVEVEFHPMEWRDQAIIGLLVLTFGCYLVLGW